MDVYIAQEDLRGTLLLVIGLMSSVLLHILMLNLIIQIVVINVVNVHTMEKHISHFKSIMDQNAMYISQGSLPQVVFSNRFLILRYNGMIDSMSMIHLESHISVSNRVNIYIFR